MKPLAAALILCTAALAGPVEDRILALDALGAESTPRALAAFLDAAADPEPLIAHLAARRLPRLARERLPDLIKHFTAGTPARREAAARVLVGLGADALPAAPALLDGAEKAEPAVRVPAVTALLGLHAKLDDGQKHRLRRTLIDARLDADPAVRSRAASALGVIGWGGKDALALLLADMKDERLDVRLAALGLMGEAGVPSLLAARLDPAETIRSRATAALAALPPAAWADTDLLAADLLDRRADVRRNAVTLLAACKAPAPLARVLRDARLGALPHQASEALGLLAPEGHSALIAALSDPSPAVRAAACQALSNAHNYRPATFTEETTRASVGPLVAMSRKDPYSHSVNRDLLRRLARRPSVGARVLPALVDFTVAGDSYSSEVMLFLLASPEVPDSVALPALWPLIEAAGGKDPSVATRCLHHLARIIQRRPVTGGTARELAVLFAKRPTDPVAMSGLVRVAPASPVALAYWTGPSAPREAFSTYLSRDAALKLIGKPALPALIAAIRRASSSWERLPAIKALASLDGAREEALPVLLALLDRTDLGSDERAETLRALHAFGLEPKRLIPLLVEEVAAGRSNPLPHALKPDLTVAAKAALRRLADGAPYPTNLTELLKGLGAPGEAVLLQALRSGEAKERDAARRALTTLSPTNDEVLRVHAELVAEHNDSYYALQRADKAAIPHIEQQFPRSPAARQAALVRLLASMGADAVPAVVRAARSPHDAVRLAFAGSAPTAPDPRVTEALVLLLDDVLPNVRAAAISRLIYRTPLPAAAVGRLKALARDDAPEVRRAVFYGLASFTPPWAMETWARCLEDPEPYTRGAAEASTLHAITTLPGREEGLTRFVLPALLRRLGARDVPVTPQLIDLSAALAPSMPGKWRPRFVAALRAVAARADGPRHEATLALFAHGEAIPFADLLAAGLAVRSERSGKALATLLSAPGVTPEAVRKAAREMTDFCTRRDNYSSNYYWGALGVLLNSPHVPKEESADIIRRVLSSGSLRDSASSILRRFGRAALPVLIEAIEAGRGEARYHAALSALAPFGPEGRPAAAAIARAVLKEDNYWGLDPEYAALVAIGPGAVPALLSIIEGSLAGSNADVARDRIRRAGEALVRIGPAARAAVPDLVRLRQGAVLAKLAPDDEAAWPAIVESLAAMRASYGEGEGIAALCRAGPGALPAIAAVVEQSATRAAEMRKRGMSEDWNVRSTRHSLITVMRFLMTGRDAPSGRDGGRIAWRPPTPEQAASAARALLAALQIDDDRYNAINLLRAIGPAAGAVVPDVLEMNDWPDHGLGSRLTILAALAPSRPGLLPYFVARLGDDPYTACTALAEFGPEAAPAVLPLCRLLLRSGYEAEPARALGRIGPAARAAVPLLRPLLDSGNALTRFRAAEALWRIERRAGTLPGVLAGLLGDTTSTPEGPAYRRYYGGDSGPPLGRCAALVLGEMGRDALPVLAESPRWHTAQAEADAAIGRWLAGGGLPPRPVMVATLTGPVPALRKKAAAAIRAADAVADYTPEVVKRVRWEHHLAAELAVALGIERAIAAEAYRLATTQVPRPGSSPYYSPPQFEMHRDSAVELLRLLGPPAADRLADLVGAPPTPPTPPPSLPPVEAHMRLMAALKGGSGGDMLHLARQLGAAGKKAHVLVLPMLASRDADVRWAGAVALGHGPPATDDAFDALIKAARDADPGVRRQAVEALGRVARSRPIVPALLAAMDDPVTAAEAADAVAALGASAVPALVEGLKKSRPRSLALLGAMGPAAEPAMPGLAALLGTADGPAAAGVLARIGKAALPTLTAALKDAATRGDALRALAGMGGAAQPAAEALLAHLDEADAARTLAAIGPAALPALRKALADPARREGALFALEKMGEAAAPAVLDVLALEGVRERAVVRALTAMGGAGATALAIEAATPDRPEARRARALTALALLGDERQLLARMMAGGTPDRFVIPGGEWEVQNRLNGLDIPSLRAIIGLASQNLTGWNRADHKAFDDLLSHPMPEVRLRAAIRHPWLYSRGHEVARLLERNPDVDVRAVLAVRLAQSGHFDTGLLADALAGRRPELKLAALLALRNNNDARLPMEALRARLKDGSARVRAAAAALLGRAGAGEAPALLAALKDVTPEVRREAAGALLAVGAYPKDHPEGIALMLAADNYHSYAEHISRSPEAMKHVVRALDIGGEMARQRAIERLQAAETLPPGTAAAVGRAIGKPGVYESYAYRLLGRCGEDGAAILARHLGRGSWEVGYVLREMGRPGRNALIAAVMGTDLGVRDQALSILGYPVAEPAVRAALEDSLRRGNDSQRAAALTYLIPACADVDELKRFLPYLRDTAVPVRNSACVAVGRFGAGTVEGAAEAAVAALLAVADGESEVQSAMGLAAMRLKGREAFWPAVKRLRAAKTSALRTAWHGTLMAFTNDKEADAATLAVVSAETRALLAGEDATVRQAVAYRAIDLLSRPKLPPSEGDKIIELFRGLSRSADYSLREYALRAFATSPARGRTALAEVEALLADASPLLRADAVILYWKLEPGSEKPWAAVGDLLLGADYQHQEASNRLLPLIGKSAPRIDSPGGQVALAKLIEALRGPRADTAAGRLRTLGPQALPALPALLEARRRSSNAHYAIEQLAVGADAMPYITPYLRHRDSSIRDAAHQAAYRIGVPAIGPLLGALGDPDEQVAMRAASTLSNLGGRAKEALPALREAEKRAAGSLKNQIGYAIRNMGG